MTVDRVVAAGRPVFGHAALPVDHACKCVTH
jgi:hypothetical protein